MKIAAYTNPYELKFETEIINRLFREGLNELHIRKPDYTKEEYIKFIEKIDAVHHPKLILHSYFSLIHRFNISSLYLDAEWRKKFFFKLFLRKFILKGKSVKKYAMAHSVHSILEKKEQVDEYLLGPVFAKATAQINNPIMDLAKLEKKLEITEMPVSAIGGVDLYTIHFFKNVGFKGVVLQSTIWKAIDPIKAFIEIRDFEISKQQELRIVG
jgi:thiamine-phosphate pyrophosphorylase